MHPSAIALIACPDRPGIVHRVTSYILAHGGNVLEIQQCVDTIDQHFFMRVAFSTDQCTVAVDQLPVHFRRAVGEDFDMRTSWHFTGGTQRLGIFVTKATHCLFDLLQRCISGEWPAEISVIISNHEHIRPIAERFDIPYVHLPISKANKAEQEARQLELVQQYQCDYLILARYMQILSDDFIQRCPVPVINIHHSFLPSFKGAYPYKQAYQKGVKLLGATSHYVTADLDEGPIIAQDVRRVTHNESLKDLVRKGKDVEKIVLARAVDLVLQHRVIEYKGRTVVLE